MLKENIAHKINEKVCQSTNQKVFIDPLSIGIYITIIDIIINAIRIWCQIKKNRESAQKIQEECKNPGIVARILVSRQVKKKIGRNAYKDKGEQIVQAIFDTGKEMSVDEIVEVL
jgi:hypothetical protein